MKAWDPFEDRPRPTIDCLMHEAILVQAWKKSHDYMRSHNWYADVLELDISTATLPGMIQKWIVDFDQQGFESLIPDPCRVVPAPKTHHWIFSKPQNGLKEWRPSMSENEKQFHLRPLAHLDIKAQSLASAVMICLADLVETVQGNPTPSRLGEESFHHTSSYGNRLFCDWEGDSQNASFRWGNANCYRKYFTDYQSFLERPKQYQSSTTDSSGFREAIVSLDLSGFYDNVTPIDLLDRLRTLCTSNSITTDNDFWAAAHSIMSWAWHDDDLRLYQNSDVFKNGMRLGLPQGLVASGFFSNVAMLDFDAQFHPSHNHLVAVPKTNSDLQIVDYCRYVDDMRLVVRHSDNDKVTFIKKKITEYINNQLTKLGTNQSCNEGKTDYLLLKSVESRGSDAILMKSIQSTMSGPMDTSLMEEVSIVLSGLMNTIDDSLLRESVETDYTPSLKLARVHLHSREVRDDTIIRFVSYRQLKLLKERREQLSAESSKDEIESIDAEIELAARKMIQLWSRDPSLCIVLRHALKLFPSPEILDPVIHALSLHFNDNLDYPTPEQLVVIFNLAEIFKTFSIDSHLQPNPEYLPPGCSLKALNSTIKKLARTVIQRGDLPWYLHQQASLALISMSEGSEVYEALPIAESHELKNYRKVASAQRGIGSENQRSEQEIFTTIANQFASENKPTGDKPFTSFLEEDSWIKLSDSISSNSNPFAHEHSCLRLTEELLKALTELEISKTTLTPDSIWVKCSAWDDLINPARDTLIEIKFSIDPDSEYRAIYTLPDWVEEKRQWKMRIGMIARASFIGNCDYTVPWRDPSIEPKAGYSGIRTSWAKRRFGLFQRSDGLAGPAANCSSWFSDLLSCLLSWPGAVNRLSSIPRIDSPNELLELIAVQKKILRKEYGQASDLPIYTHEIGQELLGESKLTVVMVQTAFPRQKDLSEHRKLGAPTHRKTRRDHLATMLRLAEASLSVRKTYHKAKRAHITLLPELSVHIDDLDLIERYVDRTKSILFCGLIFHAHPKLPNKVVNSARWIIPDVKPLGRSIRHFYQGKNTPMKEEEALGITGYRPSQIILSIKDRSSAHTYKLTGSICFDATDLNLAADLKNLTDFFIVSANNKDVSTFDGMAASLNYLMYQHFAIVNTGEFGGTLINAPYKERHERVLTHQHGGEQATVSIAEVDLADWVNAPNKQKDRDDNSDSKSLKREMKSPPANYNRRTPQQNY